MGQYYKPLSIEKKQYVYSHNFGSGLKLIEHSWRKNPFVNSVASLIAKGGAWYGDRIVWGGDYADNEENLETNLYDIVGENEIKPDVPKRTYRYFHNLDTNEFVDVNKCPEEDPDNIGWNIHPLPLLTCEGNGRGGGDFRGENDWVGDWARKRIVASYTKPKGADEIFPNFTERSTLTFKKPKTKKAVHHA